MKHSLFWAAVEAAAKATRSGLSVVGALVDCGIPRQHAGAQWLTAAEEEIDAWEPHEKDGDCCTFHEPADFGDEENVLEAPLSADFTDEPPPRVPLCANCGKELGGAAAVSRIVPGMFCSVRCVKGAEKWLFVDEGRCGDCPLSDHEPCCPDGTRCEELRCILRYGHPGAHLAEPPQDSRTNAGATSSRAVEEGLTEETPPVSSVSAAINYRGEQLSWCEYVQPAILDVLAGHAYFEAGEFLLCPHSGDLNGLLLRNQLAWRNHVAPILAARLEAVTLQLPEM